MIKYSGRVKDFQLEFEVMLSDGDYADISKLNTLAAKNIKGFLSANAVKNTHIVYHGPNAVRLSDRLKNPISKQDFFLAMIQVVEIARKAKNNNLGMENIIFDSNVVFVNKVTKELQFVYLPLNSAKYTVNALEFMIRAASNVHCDNPDDILYITNFIVFLRSLNEFDDSKIESYIFQNVPEVENASKMLNRGQSGFLMEETADYIEHYGSGKEDRNLLIEIEDDDEEDDESGSTVCLNDFEEEATTLLVPDEDDDEEATTLLVDLPTVYATLLRVSTEEYFDIDKQVFLIGKDRKQADFIVSGNDTVSRKHAQIISRDNKVFIKDCGSTNKTYVNGRAIEAGVEVEIFAGDKIRMSNEEFLVQAI